MREFPPFRLDTVNQCLWRGAGPAEERILLAPKAFAVLRYLVEHPGRLMSHDELLEALWPKTYVQPEVLKSHIAAIRAALGDDARKPIFIETRSRRGYRFIAPVTEGASAGPSRMTNHHVRLALELAARHVLEVWNAWAQCFEGAVLIKRGDHGAGSQLLQSALERLPEPTLHRSSHHMSLLLAELAAGLGGGQIGEGLGVVDEALARAERTEAGWCLAELLRTKGELLLLERVPSAVATSEACFQQALDVARRQGALSWELRSATSLARLWRGQQRVNQARKLLAPVYRRFTEGFETADLVAARTLLASVR